MRSPRWFAFTLAVVVALLTLTPGFASADPSSKYMQRIADAFMADSTNHVYVDAHASPSISREEANRLNQQIGNTGLPIYVVLADNVQVHEPGDESNLVRNISKEMDAKSGHEIPVIIGVYTKDDFQAEAHHVAASLENNVNSLARHAYNDGTNAKTSAAERISQWIDLVDNLEIRGPIQVPWKIIFIIVGAIALVVGIGVFCRFINKLASRKLEGYLQDARSNTNDSVSPRSKCTFHLPSNRKRPRSKRRQV